MACGCCKRKKALREDYPEVLVNDAQGNANNNFPNNSITTTKYTWYSFLPKNLIEQFRYASPRSVFTLSGH
jgi:hypothetical protein